MPRLDHILAGSMLAGVLVLAGCNRLTFIKPNMKKMEIEQVRRPVVARDSAQVKARQSAQQQIDAATAALSRGDLASAEKGARAALKADASSVDAHTLLGLIASSRGRTQDAGGWFKKAAELSRGRPAETSNYGAWLCQNGDPAQALHYFDYAAQAQDSAGQSSTLANAGTCAARAGLDARATSYLRQAIDLDPRNALALESLAGLLLKQGDAMDARTMIQRRLAIQPITAQSLSTASQIEARLGDNRAATLYRQRLQAEFPNANHPNAGN